MARCQRERDELRLVVKEIESERRLQRDFERRLNPRTKDDFELLYNAMEGRRCQPSNIIRYLASEHSHRSIS